MDLNTIYSYSNIFLNKKNVIKGSVHIIKQKKKVTFDSRVGVILIASCTEITESLKNILWYCDEDYLNFKHELLRSPSYDSLFS